MAGYNLTRSVEELLDANDTLPPSFTVQLHPEHWSLNGGGSKFLYNNQVAVSSLVSSEAVMLTDYAIESS